VEQDAGQKVHRKFSAPSTLETGLSRANGPEQGIRLIRAFLRITDPKVRLAIVNMVEKIESAPATGPNLTTPGPGPDHVERRPRLCLVSAVGGWTL
jgi:hypothetical protein